jgi:hypothetical protein
MDLTPMWTGECDLRPRGSKRWGLLWTVPLFEFKTGTPKLTFHDSDGTQYQPDNHFLSDGGSIPPPLWSLPFLRMDPLAFPRSYGLHDSAFRYGGLYTRRPGDRLFHFEYMDRTQCDDLLRRMVAAEGARFATRTAIRAGVAIGSFWCWDEKQQERNRDTDGVMT